MSAVSVVVIDCTETGASPPTNTPPTLSWRDLRRSASGWCGSSGIPSETAVMTNAPLLERDRDRIDHVGKNRQHRNAPENKDHHKRQRHELGQIDVPRIGPIAQPGKPG